MSWFWHCVIDSFRQIIWSVKNKIKITTNTSRYDNILNISMLTLSHYEFKLHDMNTVEFVKERAHNRITLPQHTYQNCRRIEVIILHLFQRHYNEILWTVVISLVLSVVCQPHSSTTNYAATLLMQHQVLYRVEIDANRQLFYICSNIWRSFLCSRCCDLMKR